MRSECLTGLRMAYLPKRNGFHVNNSSSCGLLASFLTEGTEASPARPRLIFFAARPNFWSHHARSEREREREELVGGIEAGKEGGKIGTFCSPKKGGR